MPFDTDFHGLDTDDHGSLRLAALFCHRLHEFAQIFMRLAALVLPHHAVKKSVKTRVQSVRIRVESHHGAHRAVKKSVRTRVQSVRIRVESHHGAHHAMKKYDQNKSPDRTSKFLF